MLVQLPESERQSSFRLTGTAPEFDGYRCAQPILRNSASTTLNAVHEVGWVERSDTHHLHHVPVRNLLRSGTLLAEALSIGDRVTANAATAASFSVIFAMIASRERSNNARLLVTKSCDFRSPAR